MLSGLQAEAQLLIGNGELQSNDVVTEVLAAGENDLVELGLVDEEVLQLRSLNTSDDNL